MSGGYCPGGYCPGGVVRGDVVRGDIVRGDFVLIPFARYLVRSGGEAPAGNKLAHSRKNELFWYGINRFTTIM